jgi:hypothetical protein
MIHGMLAPGTDWEMIRYRIKYKKTCKRQAVCAFLSLYSFLYHKTREVKRCILSHSSCMFLAFGHISVLDLRIPLDKAVIHTWYIMMECKYNTNLYVDEVD